MQDQTISRAEFIDLIKRRFNQTEAKQSGALKGLQKRFYDLIVRAKEHMLWDIVARLGGSKDQVALEELKEGFTYLPNHHARHLREPHELLDVFGSCTYAKYFRHNMERTTIMLRASQIVEEAVESDTIVLRLDKFKETPLRDGLLLSDSFPYHAAPFINPCLGSGFLLDDEILLTAGHVLSIDNIFGTGIVRNDSDLIESLRSVVIIRDFHSRKLKIKNGVTRIPKEHVYRISEDACLDIVRNTHRSRHYDKRFNDMDEDWAWAKVEHKYPSHNSTLLNPYPEKRIFSIKPRLVSKWAEQGSGAVYCIGHPLGLTAKASYKGLITSGEANAEMFVCRLLTLPGNSGSPIFDADTHELVGILSGNDGYLDDLIEGDCLLTPAFCFDDYKGARVSRIHAVMGSLLDTILYR